MRFMLVVTICLLGALMASAQETYLSYMCDIVHPVEACPKEGKEDWVKLDDQYCIKAFFSQPFLNFTAAEATCVQYGGHLVSIHNIQQLVGVVCTMYRLTPDRVPYWIGLYLSFNYEDYLVYDWTDGTTADFLQWSYGQPNYFNNNQNCVEANLNEWGFWNDLNCNYERGYVCSVKI
ncbi:C-type isolectin Sp-CL4-like [Antennarius striatus]|uniref:C-type isolectin Sp-CL4-like n=1 Tax=Antennarius striatus TaxID=241820 RepID=UPI0035B4822E